MRSLTLYSELPIHRHKLEIRRQARERIKRNIMEKFELQNSILSILSRLRSVVWENIMSVDQLKKNIQQTKKIVREEKKNFNFHTFGLPKHNEEEEEEIEKLVYQKMEQQCCHYTKIDLRQVIDFVGEFTAILHKFNEDDLEELISENENDEENQNGENYQRNKNSYEHIYAGLINLIKYQIPHLVFICEELLSSRENSKESWLRYCVSNHKGTDLKELKKELTKILVELSYIWQLGQHYVFDKNKEFEEFYEAYIWYEPARIIACNLINYLEPESFWFSCLVSFKNLLYFISEHFYCLENEYSEEECQCCELNHLSERFSRILEDIKFNEILTARLAFITDYYQNPGLGIERESPSKETRRHSFSYYRPQRDSQSEEIEFLLISFLKVYIKWTKTTNSSDIFLEKRIEEYVLAFMTHIVENSHNSSYYQPLEEREGIHIQKFEWKIIRLISSFMDYLEIHMDNVFIVNVLLPILRNNWEKEEIAKIWRDLSFTNDYKVHFLIGVCDYQVHMLENQDNITLKPNYEHFSHSSIDSTISAIKLLALEILETIVQTFKPKLTIRRDCYLMEGLFNIILEMEHEHACQLWEEIYENNESIKARIEEIEHLENCLKEIQIYIEDMRS